MNDRRAHAGAGRGLRDARRSCSSITASTPSTFTARVVTSTLAPPSSALSAAMGALYGPLHGGCRSACAGDGARSRRVRSRPRSFVAQLPRDRPARDGHGPSRVSRRRSARARHQRHGPADRDESGQPQQLFDVLSGDRRRIRRTDPHRKRALRANLEFYKGVVCLSLGIPKEFFTACFAASRIFGWVAHVVEQRQDNRLIRPTAHYVGPPPQPA